MKKSITKEEINDLPLYQFEGEIHLIETKKDALKAIKALKNEKVLGFDTETRPSFKKGERYKISLVQLATDTDAYLFRINKISFLKELAQILENPDTVKTGVAVRDDIKGLQKIFPFEDSNFIDLAQVAKSKKIQNFGLRALTAICLGKRLSKRAKISNWEQDKLTKDQIHYAACDAVVGLKIFDVLKKD